MKRAACILLLSLSSCVSHDFPLVNTCNVVNPVEGLPWLKAEVADLNSSDLGRAFWYITQAGYKNETVFIIKTCCPACLTLPSPVYSCSGDLLFRADDERYRDIRDERVIWKGAENDCTF